MNRHRLSRLIAYRRQLEKLAKKDLLESQTTLAQAKRWRDARDARRREHEGSIVSWKEGPSEELRRYHDHLQKLRVEVAELDAIVKRAEEIVAKRLDALVAARREVRKLEVLDAREVSRQVARERRAEGQALDAFALRERDPSPR